MWATPGTSLALEVRMAFCMRSIFVVSALTALATAAAQDAHAGKAQIIAPIKREKHDQQASYNAVYPKTAKADGDKHVVVTMDLGTRRGVFGSTKVRLKLDTLTTIGETGGGLLSVRHGSDGKSLVEYSTRDPGTQYLNFAGNTVQVSGARASSGGHLLKLSLYEGDSFLVHSSATQTRSYALGWKQNAWSPALRSQLVVDVLGTKIVGLAVQHEQESLAGK